MSTKKKTAVPVSGSAKPTVKTPPVTMLIESNIVKGDLSLDIGAANTNIEADNDVSLDHRSILAPLQNTSGMGELPEEWCFRFQGKVSVYGEACYTYAPDHVADNIDEGRYFTPWYKRAFAAALWRTYRSYLDSGCVVMPRVMSSIPAKLFKNPEIVSRVHDHLMGEYEIESVAGKLLRVRVDGNRLKIIPEGAGTHMSYVYGQTKGVTPAYYMGGTWGVFDMGYLTLDAVFFRDNVYVKDDSQSDPRAGMSYVAEIVTNYIHNKSGVLMHPTEIDVLMRKEAITINNGKPIPIKERREEALITLGERATQDIEQWSRGRNLRGVILTGGGAEMIFPYLKSDRLPEITTAEKSPRANVIGAYAYMKSLK